MSDGIWNEMTENLLADMRTHVQNLNERLAEAGNVLEQSRGVNEKISGMREYKDDANTVNACFRAKDRTGLVRSLQHENRQILALQEENRQMKLALEDVQRGMGLIMEKHRKAVRDFERSNALFELVQRRYDLSQKNNVYEKRFYELADFVDSLFKKIAHQHTLDLEKYAAVCAENAQFRQILTAKGVTFVTRNRGEFFDSSANSSFVDMHHKGAIVVREEDCISPTPLPDEFPESNNVEPEDPSSAQSEVIKKPTIEEDGAGGDAEVLQMNGDSKSETA